MCLLCGVYYRSNININDVLGDYSLTLVDVLDTLAVRHISCHDCFCKLFGKTTVSEQHLYSLNKQHTC